jgi:hypothetical protein
MNTVTETPVVNRIWARLVAGTASVFRKIFPRVGEGGAVTGIWDIPAATGVNYSYVGSDPNVTVQAGNPGSLRDGSQAELYFPHIGGIKEYFLTGIQTMLRPKGYGEQIIQAPVPTGTAPGCGGVPDPSIPGQWLGPMKDNFINLANLWCAGYGENLAESCYNTVVSESLNAGVNPAFSLTIWLNETAASNYTCSGPGAQDFGINDSSIAMNFDAQLAAFLQLPFSPAYTSCGAQPGWDEPMHAYLSRFRAGGCDPSNSAGNTYYQNIKGDYGADNSPWQWVIGPIGYCVDPDNTFSISWPTDLSCP